MLGWLRVVLPVMIPMVVACGGDDLTLPAPGEPATGEPATLSIVSGDDQSATVGEALSLPLVVRLADARGQPVPGAIVTFRFSEDPPDAALDPSAPATDSLGQASANARLGSTPGSQPIDAQVAMPGQDLEVRFRLTALARDPQGDGQDGGNEGNGGGSAAWSRAHHTRALDTDDAGVDSAACQGDRRSANGERRSRITRRD